MSLPVDLERLRREFPALTDDDLAAYRTVTARVLADPRSRGRVLASVMSAAQRAKEKEAGGVALDTEEQLALGYLRAIAKMQRGPAQA